MHEFIRTLAGRLSGASITIRAQALFAQAMLNGSFRWGRKAKLLSGACLAIAFREANKSDSLRDIAVSLIMFLRMAHPRPPLFPSDFEEYALTFVPHLLLVSS